MSTPKPLSKPINQYDDNSIDFYVSTKQNQLSLFKTTMEFVSPVLRLHMRIFRAIGYCTLPFNGNFKVGRWWISWSLLLMIIFNILAYIAIFNKDSFLFPCDKFGYFNDILKFAFADIAVTSSYIMSIWKRSYLQEFWKCYEKLPKKIINDTRFSWREDISHNRRFLVMFYVVIICESVVIILYVRIQSLTHNLIMFWGFFVPFVYAVHLRNLQSVCYIEVIRLELIKLKDDLQLLKDYSRFQAYGTGFKGFEEFLRSKILDKQKNYQSIYEMYENFHNSFGLSIITVLVMIYVRVLVDSYFGYYSFYRGVNEIEMLMLLPAFLQIPIFLITSKNCMDVVTYITLNLHSIISQFNSQNTDVTVQLQNFSLQILHQRICINGIGITRMDGYMLVRVIGSLTTYMIFFIKFMPKFSNVEVQNC